MKALRFALLAGAVLSGGTLFVTPGAAMLVGNLGAASDIGSEPGKRLRLPAVRSAAGGARINYYAAPLYATPVYVAPPVYGPAYVILYTSGPGWYGGWRPGWYGGWYRRAWR